MCEKTRGYFPFFLLVVFQISLSSSTIAQQDSTIHVEKKVVTLKEVVVRSNLNVPAFIDRVKNDTSFHKAFKNLKILSYSALNDIRILNKDNQQKASLQSRTVQSVHHGCRSMQTFDEKSSGDIYE
jgi:hypothetical protein